MPYTMEDFRLDCARDWVQELTPEERVKGLSPKDLLKVLSPEELLAGLSLEEIEKYRFPAILAGNSNIWLVG
jgi:hypothetical protein